MWLEKISQTDLKQFRNKIRVDMMFCKKLMLLSVLLVATRGQVVPTGPISSDYDFTYDFTDYMDSFIIGSPDCSSKSTCEINSLVYQSYPEKNCYCDILCPLLRECCPGYQPPPATEVPKLSPDVFQCVRFEDAVKTPGIGVNMVTKCDENWHDENIKTYCESYDKFNDTLLSVPVSEPTFNILFRNMYCSFCNYVYDFSYWKVSKNCTSDYLNDCVLGFQSPFPNNRTRMCPLGNVTDSCDVAYKDVNSCTSGDYTLVYSGPEVYRNRYCAACNGIQEDNMFCVELEPLTPVPTIEAPVSKSYSFRMLVDFNSGHLEKNGMGVTIAHSCKDNELYDPVSDKCREILCPDPLIAKSGRCIYNLGMQLENSSSINNCTLTKLEPPEFEITNSSQVYVFSSRKVYSEGEFQLSGADVFICVANNQTCPECRNPGVMFTFDEGESYLSLITLIVSLVALAITFSVYIHFNELLNTPGKILISLIGSLFLAQLMFLISPSVEPFANACKAVSIMMHYFFLAAFCWMNIVALDLWMTFSNQFISPGSGNKSVKRFIQFSIYGWMTPLVIVCIAIVVDFSDIDEDFANLQPRYGTGVCWFNSKDALLLFFAGPLGVFKLFDFVAFIFTSVHIFRAKRQGAMARQKTDLCSFLINVKLSLVMGLTWVFAFLANLGDVPALWYLFIIFNCLQGLFIALSFLCTNKVQRLVRNKYEEVSGSSKVSTQLSSLTPSKDHN